MRKQHIPFLFNGMEVVGSYLAKVRAIKRVGKDVPNDLLRQVKQKIQLFDADQTRFIYQVTDKRVVRIQGLSGTGKTELLLHKLKELYIDSKEYKIYLTCHNRVLAEEFF